MVVGALGHGDQCGPGLARLRVEQKSSDIWNTAITTCKQCETPICLYACQSKSVGALHVDETTGARVIDQDKCIGCQMCIKACPQYPNSPIRYNAQTGKSFKCDLCGGEPKCVKYCPLSANWSEHAYDPALHPLTFVQA